MDHSLISSYKATTYTVPDLDISIRWEKKNKKIHDLLEASSYSSWALITAWNPNSRPLSKKENLERNKSLREYLNDFEFYISIGKLMKTYGHLKCPFLY